MFSFIVISAIFWIFTAAWFLVVQKPVFALYNRRLSAGQLTAASLAGAWRHGFVSDAIVVSYLTALPLVAGALSTMVPAVAFTPVITVVSVIVSLAVGLLVTADAALYPFWKFKIDASVFAYLRSLKGATASVSTAYLITGISAWLLMSATFFVTWWGAARVGCMIAPLPAAAPQWWGYPLIVLLLALAAGILFVIIRGVGMRPYNPSVVYFSANPFLNHLALNPGYNMIYSLTTGNDFHGMFQSMPADECDAVISEMFPAPSAAPSQRILRTTRPDIIFIVWESLGADLTDLTGKLSGVTPNLAALAANGVLMGNVTSGSFRTDRGLVCLLSGYPAQPTTSIIRYTRKLPNLPGLPRTLRDRAGYTTMAVHGGDMSIMHKSDYYLACGHDRLLSIRDFPAAAERCKWGVHDGPVMERVADEALSLTAAGRQPWMITVQTLSSHEPFIVPGEPRRADKIENAYAYSDHALGLLVDRLKSTPLWDNLLIVVVADHSLNLPRPVTDRRAHAHIPLVLGGGAIAHPDVIDTLMSQTDLAATLLAQMELPHDDFAFSHDILSPDYANRFGLHIFNNGIMLRDAGGYTVYDTMLERVIEGSDDPGRLHRMRAILQKIYQDLDKK